MGVTSIQCEPLGVKQQLQELLHFDLHPPSQVEASSLNGFLVFWSNFASDFLVQLPVVSPACRFMDLFCPFAPKSTLKKVGKLHF